MEGVIIIEESLLICWIKLIYIFVGVDYEYCCFIRNKNMWELVFDLFVNWGLKKNVYVMILMWFLLKIYIINSSCYFYIRVSFMLVNNFVNDISIGIMFFSFWI